MRIGKLFIKVHWYAPYKTYGEWHFHNFVSVIPAETYNTKGYFISLIYLHFFIDWWVRDGSPYD